MLSPCLCNLYAVYIMQNAGLDESQAEIKIARRNINNLKYADACLVTSVVSNSLQPHGPLVHQAPPSMGFSRQEYWSQLPFPSPVIKYEASEVSEVKSLRRVTLCDPMDCSPTGSSIHGIFQARALEWVAISFSRQICR